MDSMMYNSYHASDNEHHMESNSSSIPRWKIPLSKSFSSAFYGGGEKKPISPVVEEDSGRRSKDDEDEANDNGNSSWSRSRSHDEEDRNPEPDAVIQILLPCIICNRTFSPEALERHSKVCTKVNLTEKKPSRGTYDSHAMRIKNTKVADFIPPPDPRDPPPALFSRSSSFRRSLQSRGSVKERTPASSIAGDPPVSTTTRRTRAASTPKSLPLYHDSDNFGANSSDFGSSEDSNENQSNLPLYARALSPAEDCPYCLRSFGIKAYDRHVSFCREVWERRQFETQPTPKELEEARERQEIRTKYRPMKGSNSFSSLRSVSPGKDSMHNFATVALNKLFGSGMKSGNYSFKKSNDSLASSCYGDFARSRSLRLPSPSPTRPTPVSKIPTPMRVNTNSNLPSKTKSTERLDHIASSGYGPGGHYMSNFMRNSKMRNSLTLGRNFFRNGKRSEPEGLENTTGGHGQSPLIITPMNFYNKSGNGTGNKVIEPIEKSTLLTSDPKYDPYEKAAKQLEELLKSQPQHIQRPNTQRKVGLDRALASVGQSIPENSNNKQSLIRPSYNQLYSYLRDEDPFSNISADETYWDEILRAKKKEKDEQDNNQRDHHREIQDRTDEKRDSSDSSMDNFKYRGVSNISSADSAFSRSDGTDLEFEALENLMGVGQMPTTGGTKSTSSSSMTQRFPSILRNVNPHPENLRNPEVEIEEQNIPNTTSSSYHSSFGNQSQKNKEPIIASPPQIIPTYAKFCHECGTSYPTAVAKFCPECGERRVINV